MTTTTQTAPRPVLKDSTLYLGDNGACYCGAHSGMSARYTGRDLSGQKVMAITPAVLVEYRAMGFEPKCEEPRCTVTASALHL